MFYKYIISLNDIKKINLLQIIIECYINNEKNNLRNIIIVIHTVNYYFSTQ